MQRGGSKYEDLELLDESGRVRLSRARRAEDGRSVVLKVLRDPRPPGGDVARLEHELRVAGGLPSSAVVRPLALDWCDGLRALVLEDFTGKPLSQLLGAPLEPARFLRIAVAIAGALEQVHRSGVIHKDIKPANILVTDDERSAKLIDFETASPLPRERHDPRSPAPIEGTFAYMSPEQTGRTSDVIDRRTDLYSLGVTFYEMLTGRLPYAARDPLEWVHAKLARVPSPPADVVAGLPEMLSAIAMRLLAKSPEERYQSAAGVKADLVASLRVLDAGQTIVPFALAQRDLPESVHPPPKVHGRRRELELLRGAVHRIAATGGREVAILSGPPGIGKSALASELRRTLASEGCIFASGGFDALAHDLPYASVVRALQDPLADVLAGKDEQTAAWRERLGQALGTSGRPLTDLVPALRRLLGEQPEPMELPAGLAALRFARVFSRLLGAFQAQCFVLFLDDLQWADRASLELVARVAASAASGRLLIVTATRGAEIDGSHPLQEMIDAIRSAGTPVHEVALGPLEAADVTELVSDTLRCAREDAAPLAELLHRQSGGNPFFVVQLLVSLYDERLLELDPDTGVWRWDVSRVAAKGFTSNVVDFLVEKVDRLQSPAKRALTLASCLGRSADGAAVASACECSEEDLAADLREAVGEGLVLRVDGAYEFAHDRVREAAVALIPEEERPAMHLRVGRALLSRAADDRGGDEVFAIVDQMNRGRALIADAGEQARLAQLNFIAGRRAADAHAHAAAVGYLEVSAALFGDRAWQDCYDVAYPLNLTRARCEFLLGDLAASRRLAQEVARNAASPLDESPALVLEQHILVADGAIGDAVALGLRCLAKLGIHLPEHPTVEQVLAARDRVRRLLEGRSIEEVVDGLPVSLDPRMQAALRVDAPSSFLDANGYGLHVATMVALSLEHGNADASGAWYGQYCLVLLQLGDYREADGFARAAHALMRKKRIPDGRGWFSDQIVSFWTRAIDEAVDAGRAGVQAATESGDAVTASYCAVGVIMERIDRGDRLDDVSAEIELHLESLTRGGLRDAADFIRILRQFVRSMQGHTSALGSFGDDAADEAGLRSRLTEGRVALLGSFYWIYKLRAAFLAGDVDDALSCVERVQPLLWSANPHPPFRTYHVYGALVAAARAGVAADAERERLRERIAAHEAQLRVWAELNPGTFGQHHALVLAEMARLEGRSDGAEALYEESARLARASHFVHDEALAYQVAARFQEARGFRVLANAYAREARACYSRWGASANALDMERRYPAALGGETARIGEVSLGAPMAGTGLDVVAVVKASLAISSEIVLERLTQKLLQVVIEEGGAQRGALLLARPSGLAVAATAEVDGASISVQVCEPLAPVSGEALPESVIRYVGRTRESVIAADAARHETFGTDPYVVRRGTRALVCLPILRQAQLQGILYLENSLVAGAFTPNRLSVLEVLVAQVAISLENATLYADLQREIAERERSEGRLRQAQKMEAVGRLAGGLAHDFNNILTGICGFSELALRRLPPDDPVRSDVEEIQKAGDRAAGITRQLLAFSRRQVLAPQPLNLNDVIANFEGMLRRLIREDIELLTVRAPDLGCVRADPGQIEQILLNLAVNARDAMPGGGRLTIETANRDLPASDTDQGSAGVKPYAMLAVRDTGVGMDPETQSRIFEPFFTTKEQGRGTGLGLSTVYGIVEQSGGRIEVHSEVGRGTSFEIFLPCADEPAQSIGRRAGSTPALTPSRSIAGAAPARASLPRGSETVLLVEDDDTVRKLTIDVLSRAGYTVLARASPIEVLEMSAEDLRSVRLLVSDVVMPQMTGPELARRMRARMPTVPVLFVSGYAPDASVHRAVLQLGATILQKPFTHEALLLRARDLLDRSPKQS
jgi:predicted ATPase/signal transduction histidine kinase